MAGVDTSLALRAALIQAVGVLVLAVALGLALPHSFFEDWGWVAGPARGCCARARGGACCGCRSCRALVRRGAGRAYRARSATLAGLHWLGAALAIVLFALWCGGPPPAA